MTYNSPISEPLSASVSGYVVDHANNNINGKQWQLSIASQDSWDFGGGLTMPKPKGFMSRDINGKLETTLVNDESSPIVLVRQLFELRTYAIAATITADDTSDTSVDFDVVGSGVANSALCTAGGVMSDIEMGLEYDRSEDELTINAACPTDTVFAQDVIPSIERIKLTRVFIEARAGKISIGADFGLATKSSAGSADAHCDSFDSTHSQCITARTVALFEKKETGVYMATTSLKSEGAWVHPLELRNFAIVNANFKASVALHGGELKLLGVGWKDVTIFYKKPALAAWPEAIIGDGTKAGLGTTGLTALRASSEIVEITTSFLYAPFPHGDKELPAGYPRFAISINLFANLDILSILTMYYDAQMSIFTLLTGVDTPAAPSIFSAADTAWLEGITFDGSGGVSLVNSDGFSRGIDIDATAAVAAAFAGIQMTFRLKVAYSPPSDNEISQRAFCHNPVGTAILNGAIELTASGTELPFGIGTADFVVSFSPDRWSLYASGKLKLGPFALDIVIFKSTEGVLVASASGKLDPFGPVTFKGELDASKPISWSTPFSFTVPGGFAVSGSILAVADVAATSLTGQLDASASLGVLGTVAFTGSISSDNSYTMTGTSDLDPAALLTNFASTLATAVLGSSNNIVTRKLKPLITKLPIRITGVSATFGGTGIGTGTMTVGLDVAISGGPPKKLSFTMCTRFITPADVMSCLASQDGLSNQLLQILAPVGPASASLALQFGVYSLAINPPGGFPVSGFTLQTPKFYSAASIRILLTETSFKLEGSLAMSADGNVKTINVLSKTIDVGIPPISMEFTGSLAIKKEELTSSFKINLCDVFQELRAAQFCVPRTRIQYTPSIACTPVPAKCVGVGRFEVCTPAGCIGGVSANYWKTPSPCVKLTTIVPCSQLVLST